ncbi:MAG: M48 family metallopeptidase [gamma proteobacterium symbiont of Bathyaustriella thionipta]|nr:M48 family metallopeptidase [gamma proteobacterium symbiont of Bathyaustriella thionipta]
MDFFSAQDQARSSTGKLVLLFVMAVLSLVVLSNFLLMAGMTFASGVENPGFNTFLAQFNWENAALVALAVGLVVFGGSMYKISQLSGGGKKVAEALGGRLISPNTSDALHRKILNVVEEMAIASGMPVPPVYVMEEEAGINAFAAGFTPNDAVIGVTRGCIEELSRDELQGVIAHEFSHILNGDMRLNVRLIGILHGILLIGLIGYFIFRSTMFTGSSRNSRGNNAMPIGLMVIGYAGTFFGNLIKAAVSRQREFLADASAVQFTRNPDGIGGALKRIGGLSAGSQINNPDAPEMSHAYFAEGVKQFFGGILATHPPLDVRIKRIDKHWDGKFLTRRSRDDQSSSTQKESSSTKRERILAGMAVGAATAEALQQVGRPDAGHLREARQVINGLTDALTGAAHEPWGARALVYCLFLDEDTGIQQAQLDHLQQHADAGVYDKVVQLQPDMTNLDEQHRLTLIDLCMPALRQLSLDQYALFKRNMDALIKMDNRVTMFEWSLEKIITRTLDSDFLQKSPRSARYSSLQPLKESCRLLFSVLAWSQGGNQQHIQGVFDACSQASGLQGLKLLDKQDINLQALDAATDKLARLKPLRKPQLLKACAAGIMYDERVTATETELLRALASIIDCPMPPLLT